MVARGELQQLSVQPVVLADHICILQRQDRHC
jgi:hypothetical protein